MKKKLASPTCGENEYYSSCGDDGCQGSCPLIEEDYKNRLQSKKRYQTCKPRCNPGACICKPGFVRNINGACIPPELCREYI